MVRRTIDELSEKEMGEMETRSAAASQGPWLSVVVGRDIEAGLNCIVFGCCSAVEMLGATVEDQDFIANAREDLPRLIREVRRLRAQVDLQAALLADTSTRMKLSGLMECDVAESMAAMVSQESALAMDLRGATLDS